MVSVVGTLAADALHFGLRHAELWAVYLTATGLLVLAGMAVYTLHRQRLVGWHRAWRSHTADWEL